MTFDPHLSRQQAVRDILKAMRVKAGFTQADLSKKLLKPQSYVSKYESGERSLDILEIQDICLAMGCSLSFFAKKLEDSL
jgi:transcriptional regulator with XRE-family HTH domain